VRVSHRPGLTRYGLGCGLCTYRRLPEIKPSSATRASLDVRRIGDPTALSPIPKTLWMNNTPTPTARRATQSESRVRPLTAMPRAEAGADVPGADLYGADG